MKSSDGAIDVEAAVTNGGITIGQLAGRFGLATHVLRHWESMGLLTPAARINGRRRYRQEHVDRVAMIMRGKEAGLSLADIAAMLDAPDAASRKQVLRRHLATLEDRIVQAQTARAMVEHALRCTADDFTRCPNFLRIVASVPTHGSDCPRANDDETDR